MKLRIFGDSVRLRLAQKEVATFLEHGHCVDIVHFGRDSALSYELRSDPSLEAPRADLSQGAVVVRVPAEQARQWAASEAVGIEGQQPIEGDRTLRILIEKDFRCLVPRAGEEDSDGFPNPGC